MKPTTSTISLSPLFPTATSRKLLVLLVSSFTGVI